MTAAYYLPVKEKRRGRKRGTGRRGVAGTGMFPALLLLGVMAGASPALCEDVTLEGLRDSYEEASNALRLRGRDRRNAGAECSMRKPSRW